MGATLLVIASRAQPAPIEVFTGKGDATYLVRIDTAGTFSSVATAHTIRGTACYYSFGVDHPGLDQNYSGFYVGPGRSGTLDRSWDLPAGLWAINVEGRVAGLPSSNCTWNVALTPVGAHDVAPLEVQLLGESLTISGAASARFFGDNECKPAVVGAHPSYLSAEFRHVEYRQGGNATFTVHLLITNRPPKPGMLPVGGRTPDSASVDVGEQVASSPPIQQNWTALPGGSVVVTYDDGETLMGSMDLDLAPLVGLGRPLAKPIHLTGNWYCTRAGFEGPP